MDVHGLDEQREVAEPKVGHMVEVPTLVGGAAVRHVKGLEEVVLGEFEARGTLAELHVSLKLGEE